MGLNFSDYAESAAVKKRRQEADQHEKYNESEAVRLAREAMKNHENNKVSDWTGGSYGQSLKNALDKINNRERFSYDLNGDALFQQYKDQYIKQGNLAMQDTIGKASSLTGGYGNSHAATAGNQAYQGYLQKLNDVVPELYQLALNRYTAEGQELKDNLSMYQNLYNTEYGEYRDKVADWNTEQARLSDLYNDERSFDYGKFTTDRDYYNTLYNNERTYDYGKYSDAYTRAFDKYKQSVSEAQQNRAYELQRQQSDQSAAIEALKSKIAEYEEESKVLPVQSDKTDLFKSSIRTRSEFNRKNNADKKKYGTYDQYIAATIVKWVDSKKISEGEAKWLQNYYDLG